MALSVIFFIIFNLTFSTLADEQKQMSFEWLPFYPSYNFMQQANKVEEEFEQLCSKYFHGEDEFVDSENEIFRPKDCADLYYSGVRNSGIYTIYLRPSWMSLTRLLVYCDMETKGGGWTVIQRRGDFPRNPRVNFTANWLKYSKGFGYLEEEFWLGNENIHRLSTQDSVILRIELKDFEGNFRVATYNPFEISGYNGEYRLKIGKYKGNPGDSLGFHNGSDFVTYDRNDIRGCSESIKGGWWFVDDHWCMDVNLNGLYLKGKHNFHKQGVTWYHWKEGKYSLKSAEMKIRPRDFIP